MNHQLIVPGNHKETIAYAVNHFIEEAAHAIADHGAFFVALSGGSTPKEIYQELATPAYRDKIDWRCVHLFWSDERSVPPTSPESNYYNALEAGLRTLPIPQSQIHRMVAERHIEANAEAYAVTILQTLGDRPFDLIMLGMGDDGHTASLFPDTAALTEEHRLVVSNHVLKLNTDRMTFTYPLINAARTIAIYVLGEKKKERLAAVLNPQSDSPIYPIQKIGTKERPALWIVDRAAAALLHQD